MNVKMIRANYKRFETMLVQYGWNHDIAISMIAILSAYYANGGTTEVKRFISKGNPILNCDKQEQAEKYFMMHLIFGAVFISIISANKQLILPWDWDGSIDKIQESTKIMNIIESITHDSKIKVNWKNIKTRVRNEVKNNEYIRVIRIIVEEITSSVMKNAEIKPSIISDAYIKMLISEVD